MCVLNLALNGNKQKLIFYCLILVILKITKMSVSVTKKVDEFNKNPNYEFGCDILKILKSWGASLSYADRYRQGNVFSSPFKRGP